MKDVVYRGADNWELHAKTIERAGVHHRPLIVLLHAGGPDHRSMLPLGELLSDLGQVALPDIRGYGRSICADPANHTWSQYAQDLLALVDHLGADESILIGAGLGTTISLRMAVAHPKRVRASVLISVEDIEDDEAKEKEVAHMKAFADRVRADGIAAAWEPILVHFPPIVESLVRDAIPRSDPASIAAAAAIGFDRSFHSVDELAVIASPTLLIPGIDSRHPAALARRIAGILPNGKLADVSMDDRMRTAEEFAQAFAPTIREFIQSEIN